MKTIEITDEQYEFLKEAQQLLKTQDNRCTRDPFYCIMKKERVYGLSYEYASDYVWIYDDYQFESIDELFIDVFASYEDELKQYIKDYYGFENSDFEFTEELVLKHFKDDLEDGYGVVFEDFLNDRDYNRVYYTETHNIDEHSNMFSLFEIDTQEYVESKCSIDHHNKPIYSYAVSSWRSTRMNKVRDFLTTINLDK